MLSGKSRCILRVFGRRVTFFALFGNVLIDQQNIVEDILDTPLKHPISQEALQRISRLSGAFVENTENQKVSKERSIVRFTT
jgi:hypothetical protein